MGNLIGGTVEPPKSRFGIDETMVPTFKPYKKVNLQIHVNLRQ